MLLCSVGEDEIRSLLKREAQLKSELEELSQRGSAKNVCDFKSIMLKSEMSKVQNKLRALSFESHINGNDIA
ncbi:MAG: hypothetical protein LBB34_04675 [Holosporales bacterium]|jgi:hypothetical protein|nr:hypothetical protein [Holosporales bacterium]